MGLHYKYIPTREVDGTWSYMYFETRESFRDFLVPLLKEPGKYDFDEVALKFNEYAQVFTKLGSFCQSPKMSRDYKDFWDREREKCRKGCFFKGKNDNIWFLPGYFYHWINFLQIYNKAKKAFTFPDTRDVQYHIALYEFLAELHDLNAAIVKKRQIASEQPHSEPILTDIGWRTMGDIQIGDMLWNPDGTLTKVLNKTNNGLSDVYEFKFGDGRSTKCGIEHNWEVYDRITKKEVVLNTRQLLAAGLTRTVSAPIKAGKKEYNAYRFGIKYTNAIQFLNTTSLPINSYVLGAILGDGTIKGNTAQITSEDIHIINKIKLALGDDYTLEPNHTVKKCVRYAIKYNKRFSEECNKYHNGKFGCNPLLRSIESLGLKDRICHTKFIPELYLNSTIENRLELLRGLMDTDGYINATGKDIHYTTTSKELAENVAYLTRSLGIKTIIFTKEHNANTKGRTYYRVRLSGHIAFDIFSLPRKLERFYKRKDSFDLCNIQSITKLDYQEESSCIVVDNPNHLYITRDFIVTHNSYFHTARIFNKYAFEEGYVIKIGASDKKYIDGTNGCWKFLNQYHNFTNKHTPWAFENSPSRVFSWTQKVETRTADGRKIEVGTMSSITGLTFDKDPTAGVGGATDLFFYEEGGIAPTADVTYGYMKAALREGAVITGQFIIAGSVGDLKQCEPLKDFIYKPDKHGFYAVDSNLIDDNGTVGRTALFIPEQWGMPPFIDEFGNSKVQEALDYLYKEFQEKRNILNPSDFQLEISQRPRNLKEAFDIRTVSIFPIQHTSRQIRRIEENEYAVEYVELERTEQNTIKAVPSTREPIKVFPLEMGTLDKKGVICIYKHPQGIPAHGRFLAAIDPVEVGGTKTSASLASIYIYEVDVQVLTEQSSFKGDLKGYTEITTPNGTKQMGLTKETKDVKVTSHIEGGKIVASWCGRYDDPNETNEQISKLVEYYNARALCENNKTSFINYMINKKRQKYLVTKEEMVFDKDLNITSKSQQTYGVTMTTRLLEVILEYAVNSITEVLEERQDEDGNVTYVKYGVERIPDKMLLVEMQSYYPGLNADRLISYGLLMALVQIRKQTGQLKQKLKLDNTGNTNNSLESTNNLGKFNMKHLDLFPNAGKEIRSIGKANKFRNPFRNIN